MKLFRIVRIILEYVNIRASEEPVKMAL